jgi:hypothetical protein
MQIVSKHENRIYRQFVILKSHIRFLSRDTYVFNYDFLQPFPWRGECEVVIRYSSRSTRTNKARSGSSDSWVLKFQFGFRFDNTCKQVTTTCFTIFGDNIHTANMAARNQPTYDFLTGKSPPPTLTQSRREPLRETFRASQAPVRLGEFPHSM